MNTIGKLRTYFARRTKHGVTVSWTDQKPARLFVVRAADDAPILFVAGRKSRMQFPMNAVKCPVQSPNGKEELLNTFRFGDDRMAGADYAWCGSCGTGVWSVEVGSRKFPVRCVSCLAVASRRPCDAHHAYGRCPLCPVAGPNEVQA